MVKHIVLFKVKDFENPEDKRKVLEQFRDALMALPEKISCLVSIEAQINENPAEITVGEGNLLLIKVR